MQQIIIGFFNLVQENLDFLIFLVFMLCALTHQLVLNGKRYCNDNKFCEMNKKWPQADFCVFLAYLIISFS